MKAWFPLLLCLTLVDLGGASLSAQSSASPSPAERHATEWAFTTGGAMDLPGGAQGGEFWALQLRWGKVLTAPHGPGPLRGTLEYAFEVVPAMVLRQTCRALTFTSISDFLAGGTLTTTISCDTPKTGASITATASRDSLYGGGFNPFFWQYNFTSHPRLVPYFNVGAGMLFTTQDFPAGTS